MTSLRNLILLLWVLMALPVGAADVDGIVVIAHPSVGRLDLATVQRLYTGRAIEVAGVPVSVVNLSAGNPMRDRFLSTVLNQDNDRYVAYWTVRRHVGKGVPPRELKGSAEVIDHVLATPGGIGYIGAADLRPGLNVVLRP
ncbi:hypothetical protein [Ideonella sp. A 288]|uniref:hypothetical protein n=1 Tax=Ideonella sp. A 288 TaxID=1962181 RepID=UPI001F1C3734|nr:hypothetical protein [Ideonella sp. A 288]